MPQRKPHRWTAQEAAANARKGADARWTRHVQLSDPDALASASLARLVRVGREVEALSAGKDIRAQLERAKVLIAIDQVVLDRTAGKPRAADVERAGMSQAEWELVLAARRAELPTVPPPSE